MADRRLPENDVQWARPTRRPSAALPKDGRSNEASERSFQHPTDLISLEGHQRGGEDHDQVIPSVRAEGLRDQSGYESERTPRTSLIDFDSRVPHGTC